MTVLREKRARSATAALAAAVVALCIMSACVGAVRMSPAQVLAILADRAGLAPSVLFDDQQSAVLWAIRLPRVVFGAFIGGALALAGSAMQALMRNPLADPGLLGVSSGAALGAVVSIVAGLDQRQVLPLAAFAGAWAGALAVFRLGRTGGRSVLATTLLAGIAINALCMAGIGLFTFVATDAQLRGIAFWSLGSLGGAQWNSCAVLVPVLVVAGAALLPWARSLNALTLGEAEAGHLGVDTERLKRIVIALVAVLVGASVAVSGIIGFVGLIVPHGVRLWIGPDHRFQLPASALMGAGLMVAADTVARTAAAPAEIPIGIITSLIGAPFFLWLMRRIPLESHGG